MFIAKGMINKKQLLKIRVLLNKIKSVILL
jgi:hypothetical protein